MHDMILDVRTKHYSIDDNSRDNIYKMTFTAKKEEWGVFKSVSWIASKGQKDDEVFYRFNFQAIRKIHLEVGINMLSLSSTRRCHLL